jgi:4-hydroxy-tetrahydrodipicolinate synthase
MKVAWEGVMPAVTTKFTERDTLDMELFFRNVDAQLDAGVHGIILGGTLGEASTLEDSEKETLVRSTVGHVKERVPVIINIAEQSTKGAIRAAENAQQFGAHALMVLPPMRYKASPLETVTYFSEVAKHSDLPVMIYNNPVDYGIEVTLPMFEKLLQFSNIQAVKESTRDITNITRLRNAFGDRLKILCGVDTLAFESLVAGADGWVAGLVCAFPKETTTLYHLAKAGHYEEALILYRWFMPLLELDINPRLVQNIKLAEVATGLGSERVRPPRLPLQGEERKRVLKIIEKAIADRPNLSVGS